MVGWMESNKTKSRVSFFGEIVWIISLNVWRYMVHSISSKLFLYMHLKLSKTLENSVCCFYTSYGMTYQIFMISDFNEQLQQ